MVQTSPEIPQDFAELLAEFDAARVRYLVIGGYAVGYHDRPRTTKDLDLLLDASPDNVSRACDALARFGAPTRVITDLRSAARNEIVWLGNPPLRIDLLQEAPGVEFQGAWERRASDEWQGTPVQIISREDLIVAKRAAGREQDMIDAQNLERSRRPVPR